MTDVVVTPAQTDVKPAPPPAAVVAGQVHVTESRPLP
jgi:hypothetical protein